MLMFRSKLLFLFSVALLLYLTSQSLNPFDKTMFGFQDPTQVGRVTSFTNNLKALRIPPRLAPEFSFQLGLPIFNFYAPTAYWITSYIVLLGATSTMAVKISFLLTIIFAYFGMYFFLKQLFDSEEQLPPALGASVYVTCTYFATEIVVRGNLSESWFLALLPVTLGLLIKNSKSKNFLLQTITTLVLALLFTSHNMMLLFAIPLCFVFLLFFSNKKRNLFSFLLAILIDTYFLLPAFAEGSLVQASHIAKEFNYQDHFLCVKQLWTSNGWGFGGSLPGCDADTMSFKIGKIQIILGFLGFLAFFIKILKSKKFSAKDFSLLFIALISTLSLFLTLSPSKFIWDTFSSVMALFQFPWRFIVFGMFGISVFAGYLFHTIRFPLRKLLIFGLVILLFFSAKKYFNKTLTPLAEYEAQFNSTDYLQNHLAYKIPEYLVKDADLSYWRSLELKESNMSQFSTATFEVPPDNSHKKIIPIHYFPYWKIMVNNQIVIPTVFDQLGRPILSVQPEDQISIYYQQTQVEKIADILSISGLIILFFGKWYYRKFRK